MDNNDYDSLNIYFKEMSKIPLLTQEEERELGRKVQEGDKKALDKLVSSNLRFVVKVAKPYQNRGLPFEDLINEGNIGLIEAAKKYDPFNYNNRFISYAASWIRQAILKAITEKSRLIRIPTDQVNKKRFLEDMLNSVNGDFEKLSIKTGISVKELKGYLKSLEDATLALDAPSFADATNRTLIDTIPSNPEEVSEEFISKDYLTRVMNKVLSKKEVKIVSGFFGLNSEHKTLEEMSNAFGISLERVRQIKEKGLRKLKRSMRELYEFYYK
jgi:RNA polymerase primary sigma factor